MSKSITKYPVFSSTNYYSIVACNIIMAFFVLHNKYIFIDQVLLFTFLLDLVIVLVSVNISLW